MADSSEAETKEQVAGGGEDVAAAKVLPAYRDLADFEIQRLPKEISKTDAVFKFSQSVNFATNKLDNLKRVNSELVASACGNMCRLLHLGSLQTDFIPCRDTGGVGAVAVHENFLAIAGIGIRPNIWIYELPSKKLFRVLKGGTERKFTSICFSASGDKIGAVGAEPDFMLTVWDWKNERLILRSKAFSQEVFNVSFSPYDEGILTTSGTGHIRFWQMARTFTGLKLKGEIGKFGTVELSDIVGYAEMPNGMVLSTSEGGNPLLWDGIFIKAEIFRGPGPIKAGQPAPGKCHDGPISALLLETHGDRKFFVTAGHDGFLRWWDYSAVADADNTEEEPIYSMEPFREFQVAQGAKITGITRNDDHFLVNDATGRMWKVAMTGADTPGETSLLVEGHGGSINSLAASPAEPLMVSAGADGTVRCWNYLTSVQLAKRAFRSKNTVTTTDRETKETTTTTVEKTSIATVVRWAPKVVDPRARCILVGFENGVVRSLHCTGSEFKLNQALKPHEKGVEHLEFSNSGLLVATAGADRTVFFSKVEPGNGRDVAPKYVPIGFVELPGPAQSIDWHPSDAALLVTTRVAGSGDTTVHGKVLEIVIPDGFAPNPQVESFHLEHLELRPFGFERPTSEAEKARIAAREAREAERAEAEAEARAEAERTGLDYKPPLPAAEDDEEEEVEVLPPPQFAGATYNRADPTRFYLALKGTHKEDGGLHVCSFGVSQPINTTPAHDVRLGGNGSGVRYSPSGKLIVTSGTDASVLVRHVAAPEKFVVVRVHDSAFGGVADLAFSNDEKFLLTAGRDDQLLVTQFDAPTLESIATGKITDLAAVSPLNADAVQAAAAAAASVLLVEPKGAAANEQTDITSDQAYSIEQSKSKMEEDRRRAAAEAKKEKVRAEIRNLREKMDAIVAENAQLPEDAQLDVSQFTASDQMKKLFETMGQEELEEVRRQMERDSMIADIALVKIRTKFLDNVEVEALTMKAFNSNHRVATFRQPKLSASMEADLRAIITRRAAGLADAGDDDEEEEDDAFSQGSLESKTESKFDGAETVVNAGQSPGKKDETSWGKRKALRKVRQAALREVESRKPDPDNDDTTDVKAIKDAVENMGDYKLKTSADYVVPPAQRTNADKKKQEIVLQQFEVHKTKAEFNSRWLALRRVKRDVIQAVQAHRQHIEVLTQRIGDDGGGVTNGINFPELDLSEWADHRGYVSDADVASYRETGDFAVSSIPDSIYSIDAPGSPGPGGDPLAGNSQVTAAGSLENASASSVIGSGDVDGTAESKQSQLEQLASANQPDAGQPDVGLPISTRLDFLASNPEVLSAMGYPRALHARVETAEVAASRGGRWVDLLKQRRQFLADRVQALLERFDDELRELWEEKPYLEAALCNEQLRFLTMREELLLLRSFQASDASLADKLHKCRLEKAKLEKQLSEVSGKLKERQRAVEAVKAQEEGLTEEFVDLVGGDQAKLYKPLYKIFRRKIKRSKVNADGEEDEEEEEESASESDSDLDSDSDSDDDDDGEEESCPAGCEVEMYEQVKQMRERRLDLEETHADEQKQLDELKKMNDRLNTRLKQALKDISGTIKDIQTSQAEKQREMNAFSMNVALKTSQMCCIYGGVTDDFDEPMLPETISNCLVFNRSVYQRMKERFEELLLEKKQQTAAFKELQKRQRKLESMRKKKKVQVEALDAKCTELQIMKFGAVIDLDDLENSTANSTVQKLQSRIQKQEASHAAQLSKLKREVKAREQELMKYTHANTIILKETSALTERMHRLEKGLNSSAGAGEPTSNNDPAAKKDAEERRKLVHLVRLQAREVDALKAEIMMLRRKGGHIYANYSNNGSSNNSAGH
eukprot:INCI1049.1.p1 GENE.INCI1049.1~~INCI1049.1.p1  ORF type:complete len:1846 (+),score=390.53 INCI1049.1:84-5621(+)